MEQCLSQIRSLFIELYLEHQAFLEPTLTQRERKRYEQILDEQEHPRNWEQALSFLMQLFHRQMGKRVIVLLDEYDAPMLAGQQRR
jgi:hypothetical protein